MTTHDVQTVHAIFKTHFDLGFTDLASKVVSAYFDDYIPRALQTAERLRASGSADGAPSARFIWTTGSWLIYEYLERASPQARKRMEQAIERGDIAWHGLPFTTHSELMDASLFRAGLQLAQTLDRRFGKRTIAAKMTDVPGHTRAIVPLLAEAGIRFLHIGVNTGSTMPTVPPVFVWRDPGGAEVIVMYQHSYGGPTVLEGLSAAITFAHTLDNQSPQTPEQVVAALAEIQAQFPGATVRASTLDAYAEALLPLQERLPVVTQEIGDTWIHGVGSDPTKVARFRALSRMRAAWAARALDATDAAALDAFTRTLLLVPEHTWGMDVKTHLADEVHYGRAQFETARRRPNFENVASSWAEQRGYLDQALQALGDSPLADEARGELRRIEPRAADGEGYERVADVARGFDTAHFELAFDAATGAIRHLCLKGTDWAWATGEHLLALLRYQTFSQEDYDLFLTQYLAERYDWALADFSKPGLAGAGGERRWWQPSLQALWQRRDEAGDHFLLQLALPEICNREYGGPRRLLLAVDAPRAKAALHFDLQWFDKPANRQAEAFWFSFAPRTSVTSAWTLEKMGLRISPLDVVEGGSRMLHAVGRGVFYDDGEHRLAIETLDAPLVAPGEPSLLNFDGRQPPLEKGMHFNLFNNVWGTNFPQWDGGCARFRFVLHFSFTNGADHDDT